MSHDREAMDFHRQNPHVFDLFESLALQTAEVQDTLSAGQLWEIMRWEYAFKTNEKTRNPDNLEPLKLNNNYRAYYARLFMKKHPHIRFRTRHVESEEALHG